MTIMKHEFSTFLLGAVAAALVAAPAFSHEMWIDANQYQIGNSDKVVASLRVGQNFKGFTQRYIPDRFVRLDIANGNTLEPVAGRAGDSPAVNIDPLASGLNVLVYQSTVLSTSYANLEKFKVFTDHKGFDDAIERHKARGLAEERFNEAYVRYAKALIGVGDAVGEDQAFGLDTEFVALENPYTDNTADGMDVRIELFGEPKAGAQVEVFEQPPNDQPGVDVQITLLTADDNGMVTVPVKPGFTYLLDSVYLREPAADVAQAHDAVWETLWAALTFSVPAQ